jgi:hypothetical protein
METLGFENEELRNQLSQILQLENSSLIEGQIWCLLDAKWYQNWKAHCQQESHPPPGPIDNSHLLLNPASGSLKKGLVFDEDYILLPQAAFNILKDWYSALSFGIHVD